MISIWQWRVIIPVHAPNKRCNLMSQFSEFPYGVPNTSKKGRKVIQRSHAGLIVISTED